MSYYFEKLRSLLSSAQSEDKLPFIDSMIVGSFFLGAIGLGLIWLLF